MAIPTKTKILKPLIFLLKVLGAKVQVGHRNVNPQSNINVRNYTTMDCEFTSTKYGQVYRISLGTEPDPQK